MSRKSQRVRNKKSISQASVKLEMPAAEEQPSTGASPYQYVITDLKRVAILAAAMFALLILLSFFIH